MKLIMLIFTMVFSITTKAEISTQALSAFGDRLVSGVAQETYERSDVAGEARVRILQELKREADANAQRECAKFGFRQVERISDYKLRQTFHRGFAHLVTLNISANYQCTQAEEGFECHGPSGWYKNCG